MAAPITNIAFAQVDSRVLPASDPAAIGSAKITERFSGFEGSPIEVVIPNGVGRESQVSDFPYIRLLKLKELHASAKSKLTEVIYVFKLFLANLLAPWMLKD